MAKVICEHVYKEYPGGVQAVEDFDLTIEDGEFLILVGPSGCGKSTMLRMIAGLEDITEGEIYVGDNPVSRLKPSKRDMAMVFQNYALYPHMTVYQNLAFSLSLQHWKRKDIHARVLETAEALGLENLLRRRPGQLSGGQAQRVALGRAIIRQPQVFLMDEPLSNLDAKMRISMRTEINRLHKKLGTTIIYVTHDQTEAMTMGDRIVVMNQGQIQQADAPVEIYARPKNRFVGQFIGSPKMNVFPGRLSRGVLHMDAYDLPLPAYRYYAGEEAVLVGVRPEDITLAEKGDGLPCRADFHEYHGGKAYFHMDMGGEEPLVVEMPTEAEFAQGESWRAQFAPAKVHVFSVEDEQAID